MTVTAGGIVAIEQIKDHRIPPAAKRIGIVICATCGGIVLVAAFDMRMQINRQAAVTECAVRGLEGVVELLALGQVGHANPFTQGIAVAAVRVQRQRTVQSFQGLRLRTACDFANLLTALVAEGNAGPQRAGRNFGDLPFGGNARGGGFRRYGDAGQNRAEFAVQGVACVIEQHDVIRTTGRYRVIQRDAGGQRRRIGGQRAAGYQMSLIVEDLIIRFTAGSRQRRKLQHQGRMHEGFASRLLNCCALHRGVHQGCLLHHAFVCQ